MFLGERRGYFDPLKEKTIQILLYFVIDPNHTMPKQIWIKSLLPRKKLLNPKVDTLRVQNNLKSKSYTVKNLGKFIKMWIIMKFKNSNRGPRA